MSTKRSPVWNFFTESSEFKGKATCNICKWQLSFRTTTTNLMKHVQRKHPEVNIFSSNQIKSQEILMSQILPKEIEIIVEEEYSGEPIKEGTESITEDNCLNVENSKKISRMWLYFTKSQSDDSLAACNICNKEISYKTNTSNLKKHLIRLHPEQLLEGNCDLEDADDISGENSDLIVSMKCSFCLKTFISKSNLINHIKNHIQNKELIYDGSDSELKEILSSSDDELRSKKQQKEFSSTKYNFFKTTSDLWEFFTKIHDSDSVACCGLCQIQLSYKSNTTNLKNHLEQKHPEVLKIYEGNKQLFITEASFKGFEENKIKSEEYVSENIFVEELNIGTDMHNRRSQIWNVFTIKSASDCTATCNICDQQFSFKSTTNDLKRHFQRKHPDLSMESKIEKIKVKHDPEESNQIQKATSVFDEDQEFFSEKKTKKSSVIWNFFTKSVFDDYLATCNICKKTLCYKTTTTNLKKHLNSKHPFIVLNSARDADHNQVVSLQNTSPSTDKNTDGLKKSKYYSAIWNHFTRNKPNEYLATCNACGRELCYRTSITNLKKHLCKMHADIVINVEEEVSYSEVYEQSSDQQDLVIQNGDSDNKSTDKNIYIIKGKKLYQPFLKKERKHYSKLWNHFTRKKTDECIASCNICHKEIGYRTSTSNLKKHLISVHSDIDFELETEIPQNQINLGSIKTCLICLQNNRELPKIFFQISNTDNQEKNYVTKIGEILNEDILIDAAHVICHSCADDIEKVYQFKQKISKAFDFWSKLESELQTECIDRSNSEEVHPDYTEMHVNSSSLMKFTCDRCQEEFESASTMLNHTCSWKPVNHKSNGKAPIKYSCTYCGTDFNKQWKRDRHSKRCRIPVQKLFNCTFCDKTYKSAFLLREHMSTHTGERNYMCHLCGKTFHRASVRHKHLQAHNRKPGEKIKRKQFLCFICGKTFPANVATRHMRVHSGVKRKECHICYKRFDQLAHLKVHLRTHSGERPYECNICNGKFSLTATLRKHLRRHSDMDNLIAMEDPAHQELSKYDSTRE